MNNYTQTRINQTLVRTTNSETGEILSEDRIDNNKKSFYHGPRKYWRLMELYDKAQLLLGSKVGILLMIYLKSEVNTTTYRLNINKTWLAEDLNVSRDSIIKNLKKLEQHGYIISETRNQYFIHPGMYYSENIESSEWQELKQDFIGKLNKLKIKEPSDL